VIHHVVMRFTSRVTGESVDMPIVEMTHIRDGKLVEVDVYYKTPSQIAELVAKGRHA
jgi:ketosteroid isomerase-like protein